MLVILVSNVYNVFYPAIYGCKRSYVALATQSASMFQPTRYYFLNNWRLEYPLLAFVLLQCYAESREQSKQMQIIANNTLPYLALMCNRIRIIATGTHAISEWTFQ